MPLIPSPLSAALVLIAAWVVIGTLGLARPFSIGLVARTLFPVGGLCKPMVRAEAERRGLPVAGKPDSQDVCFVARGGLTVGTGTSATSASDTST